MIESSNEHRYEESGNATRGKQYPVTASSRAKFDERMAEVMALPGYKTWRVKPIVLLEERFDTGEKETVWSARVIVWEQPVPLEEAVWPPQE